MEKNSIDVYTKSLYYDGELQSRTCRIRFGKNGSGLTTEFSEISKIVEEMSAYGNVYLKDNVFVDELDDVYEMTFIVIPFNAK
jgi:predicted ATP-binding protein involved in virulence